MASAAEIHFLLRPEVGGIKDHGLAEFPGPHRCDMLCPRPVTNFTICSGNHASGIKPVSHYGSGAMAMEAVAHAVSVKALAQRGFKGGRWGGGGALQRAELPLGGVIVERRPVIRPVVLDEEGPEDRSRAQDQEDGFGDLFAPSADCEADSPALVTERIGVRPARKTQRRMIEE
jgi:hypothetical protein